MQHKHESKRRLNLIPVIIYALLLLAFITLALAAGQNQALWGDTALLQSLYFFNSQALDDAAVLISIISSPELLLVGAVAASVVLWLRHQAYAAAGLALTVGGAAAANTVLKHLVARDRPELWASVAREYSFAFPSGHAMVASALAFAVIWLLWRTPYRGWAIMIGTVGFVVVSLCRVYLGVHYPSDVLGAWIASLLTVMTVSAVLSALRPRIRRRISK